LKVNDATTRSRPRWPAQAGLARRTPVSAAACALGLGLAIVAVARASASEGATGTSAAAAAAPAGASTSSSSADLALTNHGFATELGSGIYEISGRTIQVYQIPLGFQLRPAERHRHRPGVNFLAPLTFGFFNFQPTNLLRLDIPTHIGAVSLEPGAELDY
jgi:hypothetical protein